MLILYFFEPTAKPNQEHKDKYFYLLAYATSVGERYDEHNQRVVLNKDDLETTKVLIENAFTICHEHKASSDILSDLEELYKCMSCPVVAIGIIKWIEMIISDQSYFKLNTDGSPIHLMLLDEIVQTHPILHDRVLGLLSRLFLKTFPDLDNLVQVSSSNFDPFEGSDECLMLLLG